MSFWVLIIALIASGILAWIFIHFSDNRVCEILVYVTMAIFVFSLVMIILFCACSKYDAVEEKRYTLESFYKLGDGYVYSYYDESGELDGGFIDEDDIGRFYPYTEEPYVEYEVTSDRKSYWFFYDNGNEKEKNFAFHVTPESSLNFGNASFDEEG